MSRTSNHPFAGIMLTTLFLLLIIALSDVPASGPPERGRLANADFINHRVRTTFFFSGQAKDGTMPYGVNPGSNLTLYTEHPSDSRHLNWSVSSANRDFALNQMVDAGINVVTMSSWGEDFLPFDQSWLWAPMQCAAGSHDELFTEAADKFLLVMPLIESRPNWTFRAEFPLWTDNSVAPGTVAQITNLLNRYLMNPGHPEWADKWAQIYDRTGQPRYAVGLIHAASDRIASDAHAEFANGFDLVAEQVFIATGFKVGFLLDTLPPGTNAPGVFCPSPELTGPFMETTDSILGIQCFIPEIWYNATSEADRLVWKKDFSRRWEGTGIPFLMDVCPGYDAHIVFPGSFVYGHNQVWKDSLTTMVQDYGEDGIVYNSWNGYTEAMTFVPTVEYADSFFLWGQYLNSLFPEEGPASLVDWELLE
jgi:hypothetical protein